MKRLLTTKAIHSFDAATGRGSLRRTLGPLSLTAIGIGGIIGTGIFVLTGLAAAQHAGPAIVLSFAVAGIGSLFAALCYAELASMIPASGSAYSYAYATLGELVAWFIGWNLVLEYLFTAATVAVGWSRYLTKLLEALGLEVLPWALTNAPLDICAANAVDCVPGSIIRSGALLNVPAVLIVAVIASILVTGIRQSSAVNAVIVAIKVAVIVLVIAFGAFYISPANWHPFVPENTGTWGTFGWSGVLRAAGIIFFAYIGFDAACTAALEAKNPRRDVPFGILASLLICTVLYILMSGVLTGMLPYPLLNDAAPVATALEAHPALLWLRVPVVVGALAGLTSVILVTIMAQSRIFYAMAQDGLLPEAFRRCHVGRQTPVFSTALTGACAAAVAGALPIGLLGELVSIGTLIAFITVCGGVLVLRKTRPELSRPFSVPWPWFTCLGGIAFCGAMALSLPADTWIRLAAWTAIGVLIYAAYGFRRSVLRHRDAARAVN